MIEKRTLKKIDPVEETKVEDWASRALLARDASDEVWKELQKEFREFTPPARIKAWNKCQESSSLDLLHVIHKRVATMVIECFNVPIGLAGVGVEPDYTKVWDIEKKP